MNITYSRLPLKYAPTLRSFLFFPTLRWRAWACSVPYPEWLEFTFLVTVPRAVWNRWNKYVLCGQEASQGVVPCVVYRFTQTCLRSGSLASNSDSGVRLSLASFVISGQLWNFLDAHFLIYKFGEMIDFIGLSWGLTDETSAKCLADRLAQSKSVNTVSPRVFFWGILFICFLGSILAFSTSHCF